MGNYLQNRVQRDKKAPGFSRGDELSLCKSNTYPEKQLSKLYLMGQEKKDIVLKQYIAKGTTQDCSVCGKTVSKDLKDRTHSCLYCRSVMPRDYNSAWNIKLRGIKMVGWGTPEPGFLDLGKLNTLAEIRTSILDINNPEQVFVNEPRIPRLKPGECQTCKT